MNIATWTLPGYKYVDTYLGLAMYLYPRSGPKGTPFHPHVSKEVN